nr:hypothetical protein [Rodentibacter genomosp. 1]
MEQITGFSFNKIDEVLSLYLGIELGH